MLSAEIRAALEDGSGLTVTSCTFCHGGEMSSFRNVTILNEERGGQFDLIHWTFRKKLSLRISVTTEAEQGGEHNLPCIMGNVVSAVEQDYIYHNLIFSHLFYLYKVAASFPKKSECSFYFPMNLLNRYSPPAGTTHQTAHDQNNFLGTQISAKDLERQIMGLFH